MGPTLGGPHCRATPAVSAVMVAPLALVLTPPWARLRTHPVYREGGLVRDRASLDLKGDGTTLTSLGVSPVPEEAFAGLGSPTLIPCIPSTFPKAPSVKGTSQPFSSPASLQQPLMAHQTQYLK